MTSLLSTKSAGPVFSAEAKKTLFNSVLDEHLFVPHEIDSVTKDYLLAVFENDFNKDFSVDDLVEIVEPMLVSVIFPYMKRNEKKIRKKKSMMFFLS